jgi:hypothetical protein
MGPMCYSPYPLAKGRVAPRKRAGGSLASGRLSPRKRAVRPTLDHAVRLSARSSAQMLMDDPTQAARLLVNRPPRRSLTGCPDSLLGDRPRP